MLIKLDLENLKVLDDGRLAAAFAQEMKHVVLDLMDRPGDDRERSVTFKTTVKPVCGQDGQLEEALVNVQIASKLPSRKSKVYSMAARKSSAGPMLVFNELSLDDVAQDTLPFENE